MSGDGCRPTIGAMMWSEALAIATVANSTGRNTSLASKFEQRAAWIREWYHLVLILIRHSRRLARRILCNS